MERESCEQWDPLQQAPFFNYLESGTQHQVRALNTGTQHQVRAIGSGHSTPGKGSSLAIQSQHKVKQSLCSKFLVALQMINRKKKLCRHWL